jgi:hypothetical protein
MKRVSAFASIIVLWLSGLVIPAFAAQSPDAAHNVKAAMLFNFAKFVDWPPRAFPQTADPLTICLANPAFGAAVDKVIQGESLNGRRLAVRLTGSGESFRGCHIVYLDEAHVRQYSELAAIGKEPILTVGETEEFINKGGMIRFIERGHRVQFQVNTTAVELASLKVSSRLLRLAEIVHPKGKG